MKIRRTAAVVPKVGEDPTESSRAERLRFLLRLLSVLGAFLLPLVAFVIGRSVVHGHADVGYFEEVAGILPVLLLALIVEQSYLSRRWLPDGPASLLSESQGTRTAIAITSRFYAVFVIAYLALGELAALRATALGHEAGEGLETTAGSLAAGFTALFVTGLFGSGRSPRLRDPQ